jgi:hypothetical protein
MDDKTLEEQLKQLAELAKADEKIDIVELTGKTLDQKHQTASIPLQQKRWAFILSFVFPPLGLYHAYKFYKSKASDGIDNAMVCFVLACFALVLYLFLIQGMINSLPKQEQLVPVDTQDIDYDPNSQ